MLRMRVLTIGLLLGCGIAGLARAEDAAATAPTPVSVPTEQERQLAEALKKPIELEFVKLPLAEAIEQFSLKSGVEIRLDQKALADAAIDSSVLITFKTSRPTPLKEALLEMLEDFELTCVIQYESLRVTSREKADGLVTSRVYLVGDLVGNHVAGRPAMSARYLIRVIEDIVLPDTWDANSGVGTMIPADMPGGPAFLVTNTSDAHEQLAALLADLRAGKSPTPAGEVDLEAVLKRPTTLEFVEQSLENVVAKLTEQQNARFILDTKALADAAIDSSVLITHSIRSPITLGAALDLLLDDLELTYIVQNRAIRITSREKADGIVRQCVYAVDDLVQASTAEQVNEGPLAKAITKSILPDSWDVNSGWGSLRFFYSPHGWLAVVTNTDRVQRSVADLFASLRAARKLAAAAQTPALATAPANPKGSPVARLPPPAAPAPEPEPDEADLKVERYPLTLIDPEQAMQAVTEMVAPKSWKAEGGAGTIVVTKVTQRPQPGATDPKPIESTLLVVRQTPKVHREIRKLLKQIDSAPPGALGFGGMGGGGFH